jgi:hypothetical protein
VPANAHVASVQRSIHLRLVVNLDVSGGMDLALNSAPESDVAVDVKLADETVARAQSDGAPLGGGWLFGRRLSRR